jgi:hypothetical protein
MKSPGNEFTKKSDKDSQYDGNIVKKRGLLVRNIKKNYSILTLA